MTLMHGTWLNRERLTAYPLLVLGLTIAATAYVLWSNGGGLPNGAPFGSDFVSYWVAAREALAGNPLVPYDRALFEPAQQALFPDAGFFAFYYPPHYLAYMLPLGALPFYAALALWLALSLAAALWVMTRITGEWRLTVLIAIAFPAAFLNIAHGQNAFLSAALFGGALWLLPARPVLAGVLLGLLTFKPQLGLLIPLALLAAGQWRAIVAAAATLLVAILASALLFGSAVWLAFLQQSADATQTLTLGLVGWEKMISPYAALRIWSLEAHSALAVHGAIAMGVAATLIWAWLPANGVSYETRATILLTGALIATPFGLNYDLFLLAPAFAFLVRRGLVDGFLPGEKMAVVAVFVAVFALMPFMAAGIPIAPFFLLGLFALFTRRALVEARGRHSFVAPSPAE